MPDLIRSNILFILINLNSSQDCKETFSQSLLRRYVSTFELEEHPRSLVSLSYASSEEDMDVDSVTSVQDLLDRESDDEDIQVLACYYENPPFPPQLATGRAMTTELTQCLNHLSLSTDSFQEDVSTFKEPSDELSNWMIGNSPPTYANRAIGEHPIAECSQLNPVIESPTSPPLIDQVPSYHYENYPQHELHSDQWVHNPHITGLAITVSGSCGQPNETFHKGCVVCGKSYHEINEDSTLGYLERTHVRGETYDQQLARRQAFQAGMKARSFIFVPRGVSQAAPCDGMYYQIARENDQSNTGPELLAI